MPDSSGPLYFRLFNEIGIIEQLSRALFEARLPRGMLISHFSVLNHLIRVQDGRTPGELSRAFQVAKTTMTHTLSGLEAEGFIDLRPNEEDGRSKRVWITPEGRAFRDDSVAAMAPEMADLAQAFGPERFARILPELEALRKIMDERRSRE